MYINARRETINDMNAMCGSADINWQLTERKRDTQAHIVYQVTISSLG
jgi:hypothetical protein